MQVPSNSFYTVELVDLIVTIKASSYGNFHFNFLSKFLKDFTVTFLRKISNSKRTIFLCPINVKVGYSWIVLHCIQHIKKIAVKVRKMCQALASP